MYATKDVKRIALIIPCYNEEEGIAEVIRKIPHGVLRQNNLDIHAHVIDNGSTDSTASLANNAGATVLHEPQKGKGNAIRTGFRSIPDDVDYVVMVDGDDTYDTNELLRLVEPLQNDFCDVVIGSRLSGKMHDSSMTPFNRLGNWLFTNAVRTVYRANTTDVLTGYFAWKKPVIDALHPHLESDGFAIEMEMITKMARMGFNITSVPVSYHPRSGVSELKPVRDGLRISRMFLRNLRWKPEGSKIERL
jgi:glycosyltransferase involved in cell wall biosynthesis